MKRYAYLIGLFAVLALLVVGLMASGYGLQVSRPSVASAQQAPAAQQAGKPFIGVAIADINANIKSRLNLSQDTGVVIVRVQPNSPAATAGLKVGDIITAVNNAAVSKSSDVTQDVQKVKVGDKVTLSITRGGQQQNIDVTTAQAPQPRQGAQRQLPPELQGLQGIAPADRFSHMLGSTTTLTDKDGKQVTISVIPGKVSAISSNNISITPNNASAKGGPYTITQDTKVPGGVANVTTNIKVGDSVRVVVVNNSDHATAIMKAGALGIKGLGAGMMGGQVHPKGLPGNRMMPRGPMTPKTNPAPAPGV